MADVMMGPKRQLEILTSRVNYSSHASQLSSLPPNCMSICTYSLALERKRSPRSRCGSAQVE
jgi:hypothetical protein